MLSTAVRPLPWFVPDTLLPWPQARQLAVTAHPAIYCERRRIVLNALASSALVFAGCTTPPPKMDDKIDRQPFWPRPPDRPRYLYEHTLRAPADILGDVKELQWRQMLTGDRSAHLPAFEKPVAVVAHQGRIYITHWRRHQAH